MALCGKCNGMLRLATLRSSRLLSLSLYYTKAVIPRPYLDNTHSMQCSSRHVTNGDTFVQKSINCNNSPALIIHRNLMSFGNPFGSQAKEQTYSERRLLGYSMDQMYQVRACSASCILAAGIAGCQRGPVCRALVSQSRSILSLTTLAI